MNLLKVYRERWAAWMTSGKNPKTKLNEAINLVFVVWSASFNHFHSKLIWNKLPSARRRGCFSHQQNKVPLLLMHLRPGCVIQSAGVPGDVFTAFVFSPPSVNSSRRLRLSERLHQTLTVGDFLSTPHHSFIDSSGSASIPSSLIQKLRTAILIALRTVEVFNGLFCSRRTWTCRSSQSPS